GTAEPTSPSCAVGADRGTPDLYCSNTPPWTNPTQVHRATDEGQCDEYRAEPAREAVPVLDIRNQEEHKYWCQVGEETGPITMTGPPVDGMRRNNEPVEDRERGEPGRERGPPLATLHTPEREKANGRVNEKPSG